MSSAKIAAVAVIFISVMTMILCKKNDGIEAFSNALSYQYTSYRIIKENGADPARAGRLFTDYCAANKEKIDAAYRRYYEKYGDGSKLSEREVEFLDRELAKARALLEDPEIHAVMEDPGFAENAREGLDILKEIKRDAR